MNTNILVSALVTIVLAGCGAERNATEAVSQVAQNAPVTCSIQSHFGGYLTATGGGGQTSDAIHADATRVQAWERFTLVDTGVGSPIHYGIRTSKGYYLTAVGGGGRITDVIHTDATRISTWETFVLNSVGGGLYTIQTSNGHYLGHAGQSPDVLHSDATVPKSWETFRLNCGI
jgi:hypothetical protein